MSRLPSRKRSRPEDGDGGADHVAAAEQQHGPLKILKAEEDHDNDDDVSVDVFCELLRNGVIARHFDQLMSYKECPGYVDRRFVEIEVECGSGACRPFFFPPFSGAVGAALFRG